MTKSYINKKIIDVYDNLFTYNEQIKFFRFFSNSYFVIDGTDNYDLQKDKKQFYSLFRDVDLQNSGFIDSNGFSHLQEKYDLRNRRLKTARLNLCTSLEFNEAHTDQQGLTLLYYANLKWNIFWGGHTLFLNDSLTEINRIVTYVPGRVVVFDGELPHSTSSISLNSEGYRMSLAIQFS